METAPFDPPRAIDLPSVHIDVSIVVSLGARESSGIRGAIKVLASCAFSPRYLLILGDIDRSVHTVQLFDEGRKVADLAARRIKDS